MEVIIDLGLMSSKDDFYTQLTKQVDFGEFFGCNLNALWDYIDLLEGKRIIFLNYSLLKNDIHDFLVDIIDLINEYNVLTIKAKLSAKRLIYVLVYDDIVDICK